MYKDDHQTNPRGRRRTERHLFPMKSRALSQTAKNTEARSRNRPGKTSPLREVAARLSVRCSRSDTCILLVDDDFAVRESLRDVLVAEGYLVISAENGQEALNLVAT